MRRAIFLLLFVGMGCRGLKVTTRDCVGFSTPLTTESRVSLDISPGPPPGPVVAMPVDNHCPNGPKVAVIDVDGLILNQDCTGLYSLGENPVSLFREKLDAAAADAGVQAVVLRLNSPGGSVTASDIMWRDLQEFRAKTHKPVVACLMDVAAGGAYYLATASDRIVAHPTSVTGGIGVILNLYNLRELMAQFNVIGQPVKAGANIDLGTPLTALSADSKRLLQGMADEFHERFKNIVKQARPAVDVALANTFDGRVFTARQALDLKLIDEVGYLEDAVATARSLAGVGPGPVVLFHRHVDPARTAYAVTPNTPLQAVWAPLSVPGLDRSKLPAFFYLWQPEATLDRLAGR
jgi:protease-4